MSYSLVSILCYECLDLYSPVSALVPAIIYIDRWGRRPLLLIGTFLMGFWLMLVGGLQGGFGHWGTIDGDREYFFYVIQHSDWPTFRFRCLGHRRSRLGD